MNEEYELKEVEEALSAANNALDHLYRAKDILGSASTMGILDILGGGMFITFLKQRKMSEAREQMEAAQRALEMFNRELDDVRNMNLHLHLDDFTAFADYFFDNGFTDLFVQGKISDARGQVNHAIQEVSRLQKELQDREEELVYAMDHPAH